MDVFGVLMSVPAAKNAVRPFSSAPTAARFAGLAVVRHREAGIESTVTDKRCRNIGFISYN